jgi:hypothetical protein
VKVVLHAVGRDRDGWAVRSKAALLLVLVAKKQGPQAVQELLPRLLDAAKESVTHTEMVQPLVSPFLEYTSICE